VVGKRQFDEELALDRAVEVFWRQGYAATSIDDLVRATGLGRGSLYGAFGNKTGLFLRAIDQYRRTVAELVTPPSGLDPRQAIEAVFDRIVEVNVADHYPAGCLLTKACSEFATLPAEARERVLAGLADMEALFRSLVRQAAERGHIAADVDVDRLARFFVAVHQALAVLGAAGASREVLREIVMVSLNTWPAIPADAGSQPLPER
jgi:AcrR family transcriptional regulator